MCLTSFYSEFHYVFNDFCKKSLEGFSKSPYNYNNKIYNKINKLINSITY